MPRQPLFVPVVPDQKQNALYRNASSGRGRAPARASLQGAFDRLPNPDGNFVKDFQTTGFSARIWELYLAAYVNSIGIRLDQTHERPDFLLSKARRRSGLKPQPRTPQKARQCPPCRQRRVTGNRGMRSRSNLAARSSPNSRNAIGNSRTLRGCPLSSHLPTSTTVTRSGQPAAL